MRTNKISSLSSRFYSPLPDFVSPSLIKGDFDVPENGKELLDLIYAPDENGLPQGDLAMFMSDKTNVQVKEFIQSNLMTDFSSSDTGGLSMPEALRNQLRKTITDDDIAQFSRNHDETSEEYALRLKNYFAEVRANNKREAARKEIENAISKK